MLRDNGIYDVQVISANGLLSDHYNPANKTVNLSADVYSSSSITAAAVAAHECGHAVQHATAYKWLQLRSTLVPVVQFSSMAVQWVLLAGILLVNTFRVLLLAGIILFAATTLLTSGKDLADWTASPYKLKAIWFQKWLGLTNFSGLEAWSEYRRTNYPVIPISAGAPAGQNLLFVCFIP